ncbi:MAG: glycine cleavage system protein GcvH [Phaeodactylibacter sp.]|nr:glycine cleavage system protein GcvH [Phaeodactylibacter sp.]MCB9265844.1 glycine cleavage system protein GcvH [Lewinellaceae bacterium]MCB9288818.1 glycine cleavage system protein GcvH [Lewinellaceae bacterium]
MAHEKINECIIFTNLYYAVEDNTWVRVNDDGTVTIGMTDVAQSLAGPILHARAKSPGTQRKKGRPIATVESGKWVGPVKSPVTGEIVEVNETLAKDAQMLNRSPYNEGWVIKMKPANLDEDLAGMVTGDAAVEAYRAKIEKDGVTCTHIEGSEEY